MVCWYSNGVEQWFIVQHIFDFASSFLIFCLFIWQIYSNQNRSQFRRNAFSQMFNDSSPDSSFTHIVHRLGLFLSIIYVVRSLDPFALLGILNFETLVFISNNLILTYLLYGMLLIYAPISAHYYHQKKVATVRQLCKFWKNSNYNNHNICDICSLNDSFYRSSLVHDVSI